MSKHRGTTGKAGLPKYYKPPGGAFFPSATSWPAAPPSYRWQLLPLAANGAATQAGLLEPPETASGQRRRRRWGPPATAVNTVDSVNGPAATLLQNQLAQAYSAGLAAGAAEMVFTEAALVLLVVH